jgi:hypothetical protein
LYLGTGNTVKEPPNSPWDISVVKTSIQTSVPDRKKKLTDYEVKLAHYTVMANCDECSHWFKEFTEGYNIKYSHLNCNFEHRMKSWDETFKEALVRHPGPREAHILSRGVKYHTVLYKCNVNGVRFVSLVRDNNKTTQNSGVLLESENNKEFYGDLEEVVELFYEHGMSVVLFKCRWYDESKAVVDKHGMISIPTNKTVHSNDPFSLAYMSKQACFLFSFIKIDIYIHTRTYDIFLIFCLSVQIFYVDDPKFKHNKIVNRMSQRGTFIPSTIDTINRSRRPRDEVLDAYQEPQLSSIPLLAVTELDDLHTTVFDIEDDDEEHQDDLEQQSDDDDEQQDDDDTDEEEFNDDEWSSDEEEILVADDNSSDDE